MSVNFVRPDSESLAQAFVSVADEALDARLPGLADPGRELDKASYLSTIERTEFGGPGDCLEEVGQGSEQILFLAESRREEYLQAISPLLRRISGNSLTRSAK